MEKSLSESQSMKNLLYDRMKVIKAAKDGCTGCESLRFAKEKIEEESERLEGILVEQDEEIEAMRLESERLEGILAELKEENERLKGKKWLFIFDFCSLFIIASFSWILIFTDDCPLL